MKKLIVKILVLAIAFIIGIIVISEINSKETIKQTSQMGQATFPVVNISLKGTSINTLYGYRDEMQGNYMRDTIVPLSDDRQVSISIKESVANIQSLSYEVRSLDTTRLIEKTQLSSFEKKDGEILATLSIKNLLEKGSEYILELIITTEAGEDIHYYTRILYSDDLYASEKINYVLDFHNKTFSKDSEDLIIYLESDSAADNTNFSKVNIHSSYDQITWGDLPIKRVSEANPSIKEINPTTASIELKYLASTTDDDGNEDYYDVREFYRIRYTKDRIYLLDFERTIEQFFGYENKDFDGNELMLGIVTQDVEFAGSEDGNVVAFVQGGELWSYNNTSGKMISVFSFLGGLEYDIRNYNDQNDIKIVDVNEAGDIDFIVYGYMNRGAREGTVGISVFHYENAAGTLEEKVFIPSIKSYQLLKEDLGKFSYVNRQGIVYFMLNDSVYAINLDTLEYELIVSGLTKANHVISDNSQMLAWQDEKQAYNSTSIHILNLETKVKYTVRSSEEERIIPLGFMDEDFIYGIAHQEDISYDMAGNIIFPMYTLKIQDKNNQLAKEYKEEGTYIVDVEIIDNLINLKKVEKGPDGKSYLAVEDDQIMNNVATDTGKVQIVSTSSDIRKKEIKILFASDIISKSPKISTAKMIVLEEEKELSLEEAGDRGEYYYVYAYGVLDSIYTDVASAIERGIETSGVVVADSQKYIWETGNRQIRRQIDTIEAVAATEGKSSLAVCLDLMLGQEGVQINASSLLDSGETAISILDSNLNAQIIDLTGCALDAALYYLSQGVPVLTMLDATTPVLIVGYDEFNTIIMNPETGTIYKIGLNDSATIFEEAGNIFITYLK